MHASTMRRRQRRRRRRTHLRTRRADGRVVDALQTRLDIVLPLRLHDAGKDAHEVPLAVAADGVANRAMQPSAPHLETRRSEKMRCAS
jgi:hypothetical protein